LVLHTRFKPRGSFFDSALRMVRKGEEMLTKLILLATVVISAASIAAE
jgi:hypothetical protein